jgi:hypothetical protein
MFIISKFQKIIKNQENYYKTRGNSKNFGEEFFSNQQHLLG